MGYSDQKFYARPVADGAYVTGTATASGTNALTAGDLKTAVNPFPRKTQINYAVISCAVAPAANWTALKFILKNGTSTVGSVSNIGTFTAGQSGTLTASNGTFTAASGPTITFDGTSTASGQSFGTFVVGFETQEMYS